MVPAFPDGFGEPIYTGIRRSETNATLALPAEPPKTESAYFFFASSDGKRYSPDKYFELVVVE
jgi:hypothetical protein